MKYYELDKEEQEIHDAIERDEFVPVANQEEIKKQMMVIAKNSSNKTRNINIRLPERTVFKLKAKAAREGIPYQTLAASILHKNAQ
jgi:predicted DNA binding CopG/RHH family protein